jgi:hypothetical protein
MIGKTLINLIVISARIIRIWSGQHWRSLTLLAVVIVAALSIALWA